MLLCVLNGLLFPYFGDTGYTFLSIRTNMSGSGSYKVETVIKHACTTIGEGPHWDDVSQSLYYVDITNGDVHRWDSNTGVDSKINMGPFATLVVPRKQGGLVVGLGRKLVSVDWDTQAMETLAEVDQGTSNRFNDGKCDPKGRLFAGTMGRETAPAQPEMEMGTLYSLDTNRDLKKHVSKINISNGLAWSADSRILYYVDSIPGNIFAFDYDVNTGNTSNQRTVVDCGPERRFTYGFPDGMTIDTEGKLWLACYSVGKVVRFDPQTGKELLTIGFPGATRTTSCCWGGKNLNELYVTCGKEGVTDEQFQTSDNLAGSVFKVTGLGFKGTPANVYEG
ncbi:regucalcin-like isoform X1 [Haliotis asinina]|uniref:regucalcin-like isoform X1 n=1 Tax=Haliotis asinina TaxID=109174 RepID=UPI0035320362